MSSTLSQCNQQREHEARIIIQKDSSALKNLSREAKAALIKRGVRLDESGGSDTEDDEFDFNTEDEEIELELEIEAVEAEADADDADQNDEESESSADEESDGDDNDEIEFEEGFIDDDEDDSEEDDLIDDELENSEAASNFTSLGSDHGDSDAVIDEIEKYNFLDGADDFPESDGTGIDQSLDQYHYQSYDLSVDGGSCNSKNSLVFRSNEWEATFSDCSNGISLASGSMGASDDSSAEDGSQEDA